MHAVLASCLIVLLAASGGGRSQSAGKAKVALAFAATSSDAKLAVVGGDDTSQVTVVAEAWISAKDLDLRPAGSCAKPSAAAVVAGPVVVEAVTGKSTGVPAEVTVAAGDYCGVDFLFRRGRGKVAFGPAELRGRSLIVRGRRADGVGFVIRSRVTTAVRLRAHAAEGFALAGDAGRLFIVADVAVWLNGIDLSTAETTRDGSKEVIAIDERANQSLLAAIEKNLERGFRLCRDADGDGQLDPEEATPRACLASGLAD